MSKEKHEDKEKSGIIYELGYHLIPSLGEDDLALRVTELQKIITTEGGSIISEGQPQSCTLSYTMRKMHGGRWDKYDSTFFGWIRFQAPKAAIQSIKEVLDSEEHMVRYLLIKLDPIALAPEPKRTIPKESTEVVTEPKELEKKQEDEKQEEVSEEELDKQIEQLIH